MKSQNAKINSNRLFSLLFISLYCYTLVTFSVLHSSPLSSVDFLVAFGLTVGLGFGLGVVVEPWVLDLAWALHPVGLGFAVGLTWVLGFGSRRGGGSWVCRGFGFAGFAVGWVCRGFGFGFAVGLGRAQRRRK
uniref:Uncharacterized protein n=1 Tax=Fagus sylvatica TaxID=28930 RepID=A0A2N9INI4_FAGSY